MKLGLALIVTATAVVAACAGKHTAPSGLESTSGARVLSADDPELFAIATAAARSLDPGGDWPAQFAGLVIGGRELKSLSDSVARAARVTLTQRPDGKVPFTIARADGGYTPPDPDRAGRASTYTFTHARATRDSAYLGGSETGGSRGNRSMCITLVRTGSSWSVAETKTVRRAQNCGE